MKKIIYLSLLGVLLLSSCSEAKKDVKEVQSTEQDICSCLQVSLDMSKEMKKANGDEPKLKEIEESYQSDLDACKQLGEDMQKEMEGKTDKEKEANRKELMEIMEACPAYKEMSEMTRM